MVKKDVIKEFLSLKGVGKVKAEMLYNSGFNSLEKLRSASIEDLVKINSIDEKLAKGIKNQLKKETKIIPPKMDKPAEEKTALKAKSKEKDIEKHEKEEKETVEIAKEVDAYLVKKKQVLDKER